MEKKRTEYSSLKRKKNAKKNNSQKSTHTPPSVKRHCRKVQNSLSSVPSSTHLHLLLLNLPSHNHALLAPNNPKLTAQSFSPITGVESETISQFRSGKGVSFRSTFGGGRAGPAPPPLPCTGGWRRARARCCCVCAGTALEASAKFGVVDEADALDEPRRERTLGSVCGIWRARELSVSSGRASACREATSWM
jgi:hypothetical protein